MSTLVDDIKKAGTDTQAEHAAGNFVRLEDKYLLTREQAHLLIPLLKIHLNNASPIPNTDFTVIESVYYDNSDLSVLNEYLAGSASRSKMRTRRYAPNGVWSSQVFIEVKAKENGVCNKSRFLITLDEMVDLSLGKSIAASPNLVKANASIKSRALTKRVDMVNRFIEKLHTRPASKITYSRLAYENGPFRVTIDQDVNFRNLIHPSGDTLSHIKGQDEYVETLKSAQEKYTDNKLILEVKHDGNVPMWMKDFLSHNQVTESSFSKYCYAMSHAIVKKSEHSNSSAEAAV